MPCGADDEQVLADDVVALAKQYGRYGYRRVTALLHAAGLSVNHKWAGDAVPLEATMQC